MKNIILYTLLSVLGFTTFLASSQAMDLFMTCHPKGGFPYTVGYDYDSGHIKVTNNKTGEIKKHLVLMMQLAIMIIPAIPYLWNLMIRHLRFVIGQGKDFTDAPGFDGLLKTKKDGQEKIDLCSSHE